MQIEGTNSVENVAPAEPTARTGAQTTANGGGSEGQSKPAPKPASGHSHVSAQMAEDHMMEYQVIDDQTGEVVTQIPSQQVLTLANDIQKFLESEEEKKHVNVKG